MEGPPASLPPGASRRYPVPSASAEALSSVPLRNVPLDGGNVYDEHTVFGRDRDMSRTDLSAPAPPTGDFRTHTGTATTNTTDTTSLHNSSAHTSVVESSARPPMSLRPPQTPPTDRCCRLWAMLWHARRKLRLNIPDSLILCNGQPHSYLFTSTKHCGQIRKKARAFTLDEGRKRLTAASARDPSNVTSHVAYMRYCDGESRLVTHSELPRALRNLGVAADSPPFAQDHTRTTHSEPHFQVCTAYTHPLMGLRYVCSYECHDIPSSQSERFAHLSREDPTLVAVVTPELTNSHTTVALPALIRTQHSSTTAGSTTQAWGAGKPHKPKPRAVPKGSKSGRAFVHVLQTSAHRYAEQYRVSGQQAVFFEESLLAAVQSLNDKRKAKAHMSGSVEEAKSRSGSDRGGVKPINPANANEGWSRGLRWGGPAPPGSGAHPNHLQVVNATGLPGLDGCFPSALARECSRMTLSAVDYLARVYGVHLAFLECEFVQDFSSRLVLQSVLSFRFQKEAPLPRRPRASSTRARPTPATHHTRHSNPFGKFPAHRGDDLVPSTSNSHRPGSMHAPTHRQDTAPTHMQREEPHRPESFRGAAVAAAAEEVPTTTTTTSPGTWARMLQQAATTSSPPSDQQQQPAKTVRPSDSAPVLPRGGARGPRPASAALPRTRERHWSGTNVRPGSVRSATDHRNDSATGHVTPSPSMDVGFLRKKRMPRVAMVETSHERTTRLMQGGRHPMRSAAKGDFLLHHWRFAARQSSSEVLRLNQELQEKQEAWRVREQALLDEIALQHSKRERLVAMQVDTEQSRDALGHTVSQQQQQYEQALVEARQSVSDISDRLRERSAQLRVANEDKVRMQKRIESLTAEVEKLRGEGEQSRKEMEDHMLERGEMKEAIRVAERVRDELLDKLDAEQRNVKLLAQQVDLMADWDSFEDLRDLLNRVIGLANNESSRLHDLNQVKSVIERHIQERGWKERKLRLKNEIRRLKLRDMDEKKTRGGKSSTALTRQRRRIR